VIRTGKPDVKQDAPSHVPGINSGNAKGNYEAQAGQTGTARAPRGLDRREPQGGGDRSTLRLPNLSPR
jgi:hypothetical protein